MNPTRHLIWLMLACGSALAGAPVNPAKPDAAVIEVAGDDFRLPGQATAKVTVLVFIGHDCPIANSYAPEIARLYRDFAPKSIALAVVYADHDLSPDDARKHAKEFGFPCPVLVDPAMILARRHGAKTKPEAFVLSPDGDVLYRGRIDDQYVDFGKRRPQATTRDLRDALTAIVQSRPIAVPKTDPVGCPIYFPDDKKPKNGR